VKKVWADIDDSLPKLSPVTISEIGIREGQYPGEIAPSFFTGFLEVNRVMHPSLTI